MIYFLVHYEHLVADLKSTSSLTTREVFFKARLERGLACIGTEAVMDVHVLDSVLRERTKTRLISASENVRLYGPLIKK